MEMKADSNTLARGSNNCTQYGPKTDGSTRESSVTLHGGNATSWQK